MKSQTCGIVLVFMVGLLAFAQAGEYQLEVVSLSPMTTNGECQKKVLIRGNGVRETVTLKCEMAQYVVNDGVTLVIGDRVYSNKDNELIIISDDNECERRTYEDTVMVGTPQTLSMEECEEIKEAVIHACLGLTDDDLNSSLDESSDFSVIIDNLIDLNKDQKKSGATSSSEEDE